MLYEKILLSCLLLFLTLTGCTSESDTVVETNTLITNDDYQYVAFDNGTVQIVDYIGKKRKLTIPESINGLTVTSIDAWNPVQSGEYATGVIVPPISVKSFLKSVVIPDTVSHIGSGAFGDCENLKKVTIPSSVKSIEGGAFARTPWLKNKQKENPCVVINNILFDGTVCTGEITIPDNVTSIAPKAFMFSDVTDVVIPGSVTSIDKYAFWLCSSLETITIPETVTSIGLDAICNNENTVIKCSVGSVAEKYAIDNGIKYENI